MKNQVYSVICKHPGQPLKHEVYNGPETAVIFAVLLAAEGKKELHKASSRHIDEATMQLDTMVYVEDGDNNFCYTYAIIHQPTEFFLFRAINQAEEVQMTNQDKHAWMQISRKTIKG